MMSLLLLLVGGLSLLGTILLARYFESRAWHSHLMAYELHVPSGLSTDQVANWLNTVQASTHAAQYSLLPLPPVGLELVASSNGIRFYLFVVRQSAAKTLTICEIAPLLTNPNFRRYVSTHPKLPPQFRDYWQRFNNLSENEMAQHIGPVLNKVEAFTQRTSIRLMLGQSKGISFEQLFRERKVVLVNLAKGELGSETGNLLGALIISELWRATLGQVRVAPDQRHYAFAYIDEAQDIVRLPLSIADMLAQAREFKLGLCLANQYLAQLPETVRAAVLGTVKTQIAFAVEHDDARLLAQRFAPLTADELMGLPAFELAMRPCVRAQTLTPVTGVSLPLAEPRLDPQEVAAQSRATYGVERAVVEAALRSRVQAPARRQGGFGLEATS